MYRINPIEHSQHDCCCYTGMVMSIACSKISNYSAGGQKWRKIVYDTQGYADNFISDAFLSEMKKNLHLREYTMLDVMVNAGSIYQQFCIICLFALTYSYLLLEWMSPMDLSFILLPSVIFGHVFCWKIRESYEKTFDCVVFELRTFVVLFTFGFALAPILHSLLDTISTDTIYVMTGLFLLLNLVFTDYTQRPISQVRPPGSDTISLTSSFLAALCLASRLPGPWHTFVLFALATGLFALWPFLARRIRAFGGLYGQLGLTITCGILSNLAAYPLLRWELPWEYSCASVGTSLAALLCFNFIGPWLFIQMQSIKSNIYGPWDEALICS